MDDRFVDRLCVGLCLDKLKVGFVFPLVFSKVATLCCCPLYVVFSPSIASDANIFSMVVVNRGVLWFVIEFSFPDCLSVRIFVGRRFLDEAVGFLLMPCSLML